jgi:hypothetical protein
MSKNTLTIEGVTARTSGGPATAKLTPPPYRFKNRGPKSRFNATSMGDPNQAHLVWNVEKDACNRRSHRLHLRRSRHGKAHTHTLPIQEPGPPIRI